MSKKKGRLRIQNIRKSARHLTEQHQEIWRIWFHQGFLSRRELLAKELRILLVIAKAPKTPQRRHKDANYTVNTLLRHYKGARQEGLRCKDEDIPAIPETLRRLDPCARAIITLFAKTLGFSERMVRNLLKQWVEDGWLEIANSSRRARNYTLSAIYRQQIGSLSAIK